MTKKTEIFFIAMRYLSNLIYHKKRAVHLASENIIKFIDKDSKLEQRIKIFPEKNKILVGQYQAKTFQTRSQANKKNKLNKDPQSSLNILQ